MIGRIFRIIFDWSEVWALLIPLAVLLIRKPRAKWVTPLKWYLIIALILAICIDFFWYVNKYRLFGSRPGHRWNNNIFYNFQSIVRLLAFVWFFYTQGSGFKLITRMVAIAFLLFTIVLFFFKDITKFSSHLLATETGLLLTFCMGYAYKIIKDEFSNHQEHQPGYWVVGGLTLYTAVNFFIFLFYNYFTVNYKKFPVSIWDVHNALFILLCLCISIAFYYESRRK